MMTFFQNTFWRWLLYGIYALLLVAVLLYLRFPTQQFKTFCTQVISQYLSGYESSIESLRYQFPLTLVVGNLRLQANNQAAKDVIDFPKVTLTPSLSGRGKTFSLSITGYGGTHQATLVLDRAHSTYTLPKIEINGLDLAKLPWLQRQTGRTITGLLTAQGSYSGQSGQDISKGTGQGTVYIKNGTFELLEPILSLKNVDVASGEALIKLHEQKMLLTKGKFRGKELEGTFSGQINSLGISLAAMQLDLKGALAPLPALINKSGQAQPLLQQLQKNHGTLPFQLRGTVGKPVFRFDS